MRLLIITFDPPQNIGGVEGRVLGYVTELSKRGIHTEVEALAPSFSFSEEVFYGSPLHKCPSRPRALLLSLCYTRRLVREGALDSIFLLSGALTIFGNAFLVYCRVTGRRTAILLYGKDILQARRGMLGRVLLWSSQLLTNRIATNSMFTASLLPEGSKRKVSLLYPSVDSRLASMQGQVGERRAGTILFVGRLIKRKGVDDLIEALGKLVSDYPNARLEVVGDGPEAPALRDLVARSGLEDKVLFYGSLTGEALYRRFRDCDVVAMPSKSMPNDVEGFGTIFLEAGLAGKPSVGTLSGGIPEAVVNGETGILVPEGDVQSLTSALARLLGDPVLTKRLGENALARVLSQFTWKHAADQLIKILAAD